MPCECKPTQFPFVCDRHACRKSEHLYGLCQQEYFCGLYEAGKGPGQPRNLTPETREQHLQKVREQHAESIPVATFPCIYRGQMVRAAACDLCGIRGQPFEVYSCEKHGECSILKKHSKVTSCSGCNDRLESRPSNLKPLPVPTGFPERPPAANIVDARGQPADVLRGSQRGGTAFLICGGPSLNDLNLEQLKQPGIYTAAVNNAAVVFRPNVWIAVDAAERFQEIIHRDPAPLKFQRRSGAGGKFRTYQKDWIDTGLQTRWMQNAFFYEHSGNFKADDFLTRKRICWGGPEKHSCSVMFVALRILFWLGIKRIFILGADFKMTPDRTYAFDEPKAVGSCRGNNGLYSLLNDRFRQLLPHFEKAGLEVYNCTPGGNLHAFPRVTLEEAVDVTLHHFPDEVRTRGLYAGSDPNKKQVD